MTVNTALPVLGPALLILLALTWGLARLLLLYRRDGVRVVQWRRGRILGIERGLVALAVLLDLYLLGRPLFPVFDDWFQAWPSPAPLVGLLLAAGGLALMAMAQTSMGRAWRIGLPPADQAGEALITGGLFRYSRNPIYLGILITLLGFALAAPSPITLAAPILTYLGLRRIIAREEAFLRSRFGPAFDAYAARVSRWL